MTPVNKQKIALITDSCSDLSPEQLQGKPIYVVPLVIRCADGEYQDGVDITAADVYQRLKTELPRTSLPTGDSIEGVLDQIKADGYEKVIAVMLSSGLSGTCNMVRLAGEACEGLEVITFDSLSGSLGAGAIVLQLAEYLEQGVAWETLLKRTEVLIRNVHPFFSVDTLEYLQKGGRIGKVTAIAGTLLNIKPLISFTPDGQLGSVAKVRGRKQLQTKLIELVGEHMEGVKQFDLMIANGGAPEEMAELEGKIKAAYPGFRNFWTCEIDATLSVYIGPGVLGAGVLVLDEIEEK
jgi:DegV family protein with EDD domain